MLGFRWHIYIEIELFFRYFNFYFYFILLHKIVLVLPYIDRNPPLVYMQFQTWIPLPSPSPQHPSGSSPCTSPKHAVSCIGHISKKLNNKGHPFSLERILEGMDVHSGCRESITTSFVWHLTEVEKGGKKVGMVKRINKEKWFWEQ